MKALIILSILIFVSNLFAQNNSKSLDKKRPLTIEEYMAKEVDEMRRMMDDMSIGNTFGGGLTSEMLRRFFGDGRDINSLGDFYDLKNQQGLNRDFEISEKENDEEVIFEITLPEGSSENSKVSVQNNMVSIQTQVEKRTNYGVSRSSSSSSFSIPEGLDTSKAEIAQKLRVVTIKIPKTSNGQKLLNPSGISNKPRKQVPKKGDSSINPKRNNNNLRALPPSPEDINI